MGYTIKLCSLALLHVVINKINNWQNNKEHVITTWICVFHHKLKASSRGRLTKMAYVHVHAFWVVFLKIWYSSQRVFIRDEGAQIT